MSISIKKSAVSQSEINERIAEYRQVGFERRLPAQVVYPSAHALCPWAGCNQRIDGIHFQLDKWVPPEDLDRLLKAWWAGPGLIGRCPECAHPVLFALTHKSRWTDLVPKENGLPEDWAQKAHLVMKPDRDRKRNGVQ